MSSSFHYLPPIEESSEPSSGRDSKSNIFDTLLKSFSYHDISNNDLYECLSDSFQSRCHTFPKYSKTSLINKSYKSMETRTFYPLEPRELDPEAFYQLYTADSLEELQEFLLLESQCMLNDNGLHSDIFTSSNTST